MKLVHVVPIKRGFQKDSLSYFTMSDISNGTIVQATIRNKEVPSIVIGQEDVTDVKARIKTGNFSLKKITSKNSKKIFLPKFIQATEQIAEYYATTTGAVLYSLIPKAILDEANTVRQISKKDEEVKISITSEKLLLQASTKERIEQYRNLVREEFAKKHSVFITVPTIQNGDTIYSKLHRGIEKYTFVFNSSLSKKEIISKWNKVLQSKHPVLIIGTGTFLSIPRKDINTIIVEKEQARSYKGLHRPYLDIRICSEIIAANTGARLILADMPLRVDSIYKFRKGEVDELSPIRVRTQLSLNTELVDMRKKEFSIFSDDVKKNIQHTIDKNGKVFVFAARRGLSPITVCQDCGNTVVCSVTEVPVVLHKGKDENVFVCHASGTIRSARERCKFCGSWKLQSLGIGIELVEKELKELFPKTNITVISKDTTRTHIKTKKTVEKFYSSRGGILVGTEMTLPYLTENIETSVISSMDSLLSIPEWNVYEKIFSIILRIQEITSTDLFLQTRKPEQYILSTSLRGNLSDFYREELEQRKKFGYPPYSKLIKISVEGSSSRVQKEIEEIEKLLPLSGKSHLIHQGKNKYTIHGFLRLEEWPDKNIIKLLKKLPPNVIVNVDPSSIL